MMLDVDHPLGKLIGYFAWAYGSGRLAKLESFISAYMHEFWGEHPWRILHNFRLVESLR